MPKRRNLNGLPHNLVKSFFGTERYYSCGYMADWLENAAKQLDIKEATLDIFNASVTPAELNIHPLIINLTDLKAIIEKELKGNGFPPDFITEAKIKVQFSTPNAQSRRIYCFPTLTDKEGHKYEPERRIEDATEKPFNAFDEKNINPAKSHQTFFEKFKSIVFKKNTSSS